jgi:hypothetical protein
VKIQLIHTSLAKQFCCLPSAAFGNSENTVFGGANIDDV